MYLAAIRTRGLASLLLDHSSPILFRPPTSPTYPSHPKLPALFRDILSLMHPKEKFRAIYAIRLKFAHFMRNTDVTRAQKYP